MTAGLFHGQAISVKKPDNIMIKRTKSLSKYLYMQNIKTKPFNKMNTKMLFLLCKLLPVNRFAGSILDYCSCLNV